MRNIKLIDVPSALIMVIIFIALLTFGSATEGNHYFEDDNLVENVQLVILFTAMVVCIKGYLNKDIPSDISKLFLIVAFVVFCMIGREVNWGRKLLPHLYVPYLQFLKYGSVFVGVVCIGYFIKKKLYNASLYLLKKATIYASDIVLVIFFCAGAIAYESLWQSTKYEETFETMVYCMTVNLAIKYCLNKKNRLNL